MDQLLLHTKRTTTNTEIITDYSSKLFSIEIFSFEKEIKKEKDLALTNYLLEISPKNTLKLVGPFSSQSKSPKKLFQS